MFLPIGDEPNPRGTPWVNYVLIATNIAVWVLVCWPQSLQGADPTDPLMVDYLRVMSTETQVAPQYLVSHISAYDLFIFGHGFRPDSPSFLTLFTSLFLHAGWLHLLGNMLFLYIFGDNVELHVGRLTYALVYLLSGAVATVFFALFRLQSSVPLVGASGAISGVLGCYFVWFPQNKVKVLMVLFFIDVVRIPARWVLGFYLVVENLLPFLSRSESGGVAHGAHIGGFLGGAGFALAQRRWRRGMAPPDPIYAWAPPRQQAAAELDNFNLAMGGQDTTAALRAYTVMSMAERNSIADDDILKLADWLTQERRFEPALTMLQRFIATRLMSRLLPQAHLRAGFIWWRGLQRPSAASQHFLTVLDLDGPAVVNNAARQALAAMQAEGPG